VRSRSTDADDGGGFCDVVVRRGMSVTAAGVLQHANSRAQAPLEMRRDWGERISFELALTACTVIHGSMDHSNIVGPRELVIADIVTL